MLKSTHKKPFVCRSTRLSSAQLRLARLPAFHNMHHNTCAHTLAAVAAAAVLNTFFSSSFIQQQNAANNPLFKFAQVYFNCCYCVGLLRVNDGCLTQMQRLSLSHRHSRCLLNNRKPVDGNNGLNCRYLLNHTQVLHFI